MNELSTTMEASAWFPQRSPVRQALAAHQSAVESAAHEVGAFQKRVRRAEAVVAEADSAVREAAVAIAAIDAGEVAALAAHAGGGLPPSPRAANGREAAEARLAAATRHAGHARQAFNGATAPLHEAQRRAVAIQAGGVELVAAVIAEEHRIIIAELDDARSRFIALDLAARSCSTAFSDHGRTLQGAGKGDAARPWFAIAQGAAEAVIAMPRLDSACTPGPLYREADRWVAFARRLETDPDATW